jgi:RING finger protein 170
MDASELENRDDRLFEGVGDEIVWTTGLIGVCGLIIFVYLIKEYIRTATRDNIHPQQEEVVQRAREQLREANNNEEEGEGEERQDNEGINAEQYQCPVCLAPVTYPVDTNCGHKFCAQCVLAYWHADRWPAACRCPVCRREVTLLITDQWYERNNRYIETTRQIHDYNLRMSGQMRPLLSYIYDIPTLLRHLWNDLFTIGGLLFIHRLHILLVFLIIILYIFIPFDILPEAVIGFIGYADDIIILLGAIIYMTLIYRAYITNRGMVQ